MRIRGRRFLLNPSGIQSTAAIVAEIEDTRTWLAGRFRKGTPLHWDDDTAWNLEPDIMLKISDCDRAVTLAIEFGNGQKRRAALHEIDRMIEALTEFRVALEDEQGRYITRLREARLAGPPPPEHETSKAGKA